MDPHNTSHTSSIEIFKYEDCYDELFNLCEMMIKTIDQILPGVNFDNIPTSLTYYVHHYCKVGAFNVRHTAHHYLDDEDVKGDVQLAIRKAAVNLVLGDFIKKFAYDLDR